MPATASLAASVRTDRRSGDRRHQTAATTNASGKIAVVSTGEVTKTFGQASYEEDGHALTIQVRADGSSPIKRGDRVVLVDWDESRHAFEIEKLPSHDDVLLHRDAKAEVEALAEAEAAAAESHAKTEQTAQK